MIPFVPVRPARAGLVLLGSLLLAPMAPAQFFTYGVACGTPVTNEASTLPYLGMRYRLRSAGHPQGSLAIAVLGFQQTALPLPFGPGCFLLTMPAATVVLPVDGAGAAELALDVPMDPLLLGLTVFDQWVGIDPQGQFAMSVGGGAMVDNPQLTVLAVSPGPLAVGANVSVTAMNLGTTRPQDLCMGVMASGNAAAGRGLIRVTAITPTGTPGVDTVTGVVQSLPKDPAGGQVQGVVAIMRGDGNELAPLPGMHRTWGWIGPDLPEAGGAHPHPVAVTPDPRTRLAFVASGGDVVLEVPDATYSGNATPDAHWNAGGKHYDSFLGPLPISGTATATQLRDLLLPAIQNRYTVLYPGLLQVTADTVNGNPAVRIEMLSGDPVTNVGGSVWI